MNDNETPDEFEPAEDDLLTETLLCDIDDENICDEDDNDDLILSEQEEQNHRLPECVLFYNATKSGVDIVDKKIRAFSCKRKCSRWPVAVVCNIWLMISRSFSHIPELIRLKFRILTS